MAPIPDARPDLYDQIGRGYDATRRADPRIEAQIRAALDGFSPVVNIGAGTGSYESACAEVMAVEPSAEMISRRPAGSAPVLQACAEALPFDDDHFDAALGVLTVHHWQDWRLGLAEVRRVVRRRIVLLTHAFVGDAFWLLDYFPAIPQIDAGRMPALSAIADELPGARFDVVPIAKDCEDGFLCAWWARPEAYLDPVVRAGISCFPGMSGVEARVDLLRDDLASGRWHERYGSVLERDWMDFGYRLVTWDMAV